MHARDVSPAQIYSRIIRDKNVDVDYLSWLSTNS